MIDWSSYGSAGLLIWSPFATSFATVRMLQQIPTNFTLESVILFCYSLLLELESWQQSLTLYCLKPPNPASRRPHDPLQSSRPSYSRLQPSIESLLSSNESHILKVWHVPILNTILSKRGCSKRRGAAESRECVGADIKVWRPSTLLHHPPLCFFFLLSSST